MTTLRRSWAQNEISKMKNGIVFLYVSFWFACACRLFPGLLSRILDACIIYMYAALSIVFYLLCARVTKRISQLSGNERPTAVDCIIFGVPLYLYHLYVTSTPMSADLI